MNLLFLLAFDGPLAEVTADSGASGVNTGLVVLAILVVATVLLARSVGRLRNELDGLKESMQPKPVRSLPTASAIPDELSPAQVAVIAAAVYMVFGADAKIVSVGQGDTEWQAWSREGRRQVFQSHQIR